MAHLTREGSRGRGEERSKVWSRGDNSYIYMHKRNLLIGYDQVVCPCEQCSEPESPQFQEKKMLECTFLQITDMLKPYISCVLTQQVNPF